MENASVVKNVHFRSTQLLLTLLTRNNTNTELLQLVMPRRCNFHNQHLGLMSPNLGASLSQKEHFDSINENFNFIKEALCTFGNRLALRQSLFIRITKSKNFSENYDYFLVAYN